jgi:hypothetical protein
MHMHAPRRAVCACVCPAPPPHSFHTLQADNMVAESDLADVRAQAGAAVAAVRAEAEERLAAEAQRTAALAAELAEEQLKQVIGIAGIAEDSRTDRSLPIQPAKAARSRVPSWPSPLGLTLLNHATINNAIVMGGQQHSDAKSPSSPSSMQSLPPPPLGPTLLNRTTTLPYYYRQRARARRWRYWRGVWLSSLARSGRLRCA